MTAFAVFGNALIDKLMMDRSRVFSPVSEACFKKAFNGSFWMIFPESDLKSKIKREKPVLFLKKAAFRP